VVIKMYLKTPLQRRQYPGLAGTFFAGKFQWKIPENPGLAKSPELDNSGIFS